MRTYQLYAAATSTGADNSANIMVPSKTRIREVIIQMTGAATDAVFSAEVSLSSTSQFATNDALNVLGRFMAQGTGSAMTGLSPITSHPNATVDQGQKIYLHTLMSASTAWRCVVTIITE